MDGYDYSSYASPATGGYASAAPAAAPTGYNYAGGGYAGAAGAIGDGSAYSSSTAAYSSGLAQQATIIVTHSLPNPRGL